MTTQGDEFSEELKNLAPTVFPADETFQRVHDTSLSSGAKTASPAAPSLACTSILDNDLYKFTMQQAVRQHYLNTPCDYYFTNRSPELASLPQAAIPWLQSKIESFADLRLTVEERLFLEQRCPYLTKEYLDWLQHEFRFMPEQQIKIEWHSETTTTEQQPEATPSITKAVATAAETKKASVEITVMGDWHQVILYEVPVLALVSEAYFRFGDQDWTYEGQFEAAAAKAERLVQAGALFAEFGTRRRRDYETQRIVLEGLIAGSERARTAASVAHLAGSTKPGMLTGTSNLHFAHVMGLAPIGTMAHEWFMGTAAILKDAGPANEVALRRWAETYPGQVLGIALTDTFMTETFLKAFKHELARDWVGVRHDSGDAFEFMDRIIRHYDQDPFVGPEIRRTKKIVFSDGLNTDLAIRLQQAADQKGIQASFGIGTHFTNDYQHAQDPSKSKSVAMNIVIKLHSCNGQECVKLSDDQGKESGSPETVARVREQIAMLV